MDEDVLGCVQQPGHAPQSLLEPDTSSSCPHPEDSDPQQLSQAECITKQAEQRPEGQGLLTT